VLYAPATDTLVVAVCEVDPGVGKTHLALSLAIAAAESGRRVYYGTLVALIESLEQARAAGQLARRLRVLSHPALLVVDEIGYLPVSRDGGVLDTNTLRLC
jgi:DNA replication protein DnaC